MGIKDSIRKALLESCLYNSSPPPTFVDYGCMDPLATNYEPSATHPCNNVGPNNNACGDCFGNTDHCGPGTYPGDCCSYPVTVPGCVDPTALNYNYLATLDDGSCLYDVLGCTDTTANNYNSLANVDDGSCTYDVYGCTDQNAINYNMNANIDDNSCTYDVLGCTDQTAINYDPLATTDNGSCQFEGCTDPTANNYDPIANVDDNSCTYNLGCTDSTATNYDPNAVVDDGSCIYDVYGCTDSNAMNYDSTATIDDNSCVYAVYGCTDATAFNHDPLATVDDKSCIYDLEPCCEWCATGPPQGSSPPQGCEDWMCNNNNYCPPVTNSDNPCDGLIDYLKDNYSNWTDPNQPGSVMDLDVIHFCEKCKYEGLNDPMCKCCWIEEKPCDKQVLYNKLQQDYNIGLPEFCKHCKDGTIQDISCKCCKKFEKIKKKKRKTKLGEEIKRIKKLL